VDEARTEARKLIAAFAPHVARGARIVGLEPSCLFTLKDEYEAMGLGDAAAEIAAAATTFENFVADCDLPLKPLPHSTALVHGHCHQKSFGAMDDATTALKRIPGLEVKPIESSCCGMAGSFGYEVEHFDVSIRMAEASLLPALRAAPADALVVADGTSCRAQIRDGSRREALHVARVLDNALD
jgi:Fe-S oxidoreductase